MARFQSRLFNWIDGSLPAKLGRKARDWYEQVGNPVKKAAENIKKTTTKAVFYPVYFLASSANISSKSNPKQVPLLLKPLQSLVLWIDRQQIYGIEKVPTYNKRDRNPNRNLNYKKSRNFDPSIMESEQLLLSAENASLNSNDFDNKFNRIQQLIKDAIAYFSRKKSRIDKLKSSPKEALKKNQQPWLTMADVFDDDGTVWPPQIISSKDLSQVQAIAKLTNQSSDISVDISRASGKITSATSQELGENPSTQSSRPLYAWIEDQSTFLGYVYNPLMQLVDWLDQLIANIEKWLIKLWQAMINLVRRLLKLG